MVALRTAAVCASLALALAGAAKAPAAGFVDVLDTPARITPLATTSLMQAVTRAGDKLVAVGQRGHILVSADGGASWKQAPVPVSSDLTAVSFADANAGWAVGHDGVVLATSDAGATWRVQLDGRKANELVLAAAKRRSDAEPASAEAKRLVAEAERFVEQGADKPLLDVHFTDANNGYAVGAYNLVFRTRDGGRSWESLFDRTDNPKLQNLHAIRPAAGDLYIAGEGGLVMKLDPATQRFRALETGYAGSFFGITGGGSSVLAFGLRGNVYRSEDAGRTWTKVDAGLPAAVVASARTSRNAVVLADVGGRVVATEDGGRTFRQVALQRPMPVTSIAEAGEDRFAVTGPRGVAVTSIAGR